MLIFVSAVFVLGRHGYASVTDGIIPGAEDGECCGASLCSGGDAVGFICKVALLKGEPAEARQAQEVTEEKVCSLSSSSAKGARWLVVSEMEHRH
jgi:hypothetical protein